jgi:hypothetical protein
MEEFDFDSVRVVPAGKISRIENAIKKWTYHTEDDSFAPPIMNNENKIFIGVSDIIDMLVAETLSRRSKSLKQTIFRSVHISANRKSWSEWIEKTFPEFFILEGTSSAGFILNKETDEFFRYDVNSTSTEISVYGSSEFVKGILKKTSANFEEVVSHIEWVYSTQGHSATIPLNKSRLPVDEMYPFLEEPLEEFYDNFMNSNSNILLLIGPPGTGKTTFIRGLLSHTNSSAYVTYDSSILDKDHIFANFVESESKIMVLEDSDTFLKPRNDGNSMMAKFLNLGDGLVTTKGKKLIFSTNLPSIRDIDSALTRPGRCFGVLSFNGLTYEESVKLKKKLNLKAELPKRNKSELYTLAEIFNGEQNITDKNQITRKVGFI